MVVRFIIGGMEKWKLILGIALNIISSISIVFTNKYIYTYAGIPSVSLTLMHFVMTGLGIHICAKLEVFEPKKLVVRSVLPLSAALSGFVVLTNLSLQYNTVGTYQVAKAMTTPVILLIQTYYYHKSTPLVIQVSTVSVSTYI